MKNLKRLMLSFAIASTAMVASAPSFAETPIRVGSWLPQHIP